MESNTFSVTTIITHISLGKKDVPVKPISTPPSCETPGSGQGVVSLNLTEKGSVHGQYFQGKGNEDFLLQTVSRLVSNAVPQIMKHQNQHLGCRTSSRLSLLFRFVFLTMLPTFFMAYTPNKQIGKGSLSRVRSTKVSEIEHICPAKRIQNSTYER